MKKIKLKKRYFGILGLLLIGLSFYLLTSNPKNKDERTLVTVLDKIPTASAYKISAKFYLVLRDEVSKKVFDVTVRPSTYSQSVIGQQYFFNLSYHDIHGKEDWNGHSVWSFILFIVGFILVGLVAGIALDEDLRSPYR